MFTLKELSRPDAMLMNILPRQKIDTEAVYTQSQFVFSHRVDGKLILFNTLTRGVFEIDGEYHGQTTGREIADDKDLKTLLEGYFLVPESKDECAFYKGLFRIMHSFASVKGIQGYTVLPTFACNARCVYCYEEGMKPKAMTRETALQTVDYILRTRNCDNVTMNWFGGEPILGEDIIDLILGKLREAGINYVSTMISNGSLITPEIVAKMRNDWNLKSIQISMDGARDDYYARKRYVSGDEHYEKVMRSVSDLSEAGIKVVIRCNVDGDNWQRIRLFINDAGDLIRHKDNVSLYFCPLFSVRSSDKDVEIWREIIAAGPMIEEAGFHRCGYMGFLKGFRRNYCIADGNSVVIAPDGSLFACEHCLPESRYGDVAEGPADEEALNAFSRSDHIRDKCKACVFLPECTGFASCPVEDRHCIAVREMLAADMLEKLSRKTDLVVENGIAAKVC